MSRRKSARMSQSQSRDRPVLSQSQPTMEEMFDMSQSQTNIDELVNNCVRFFVNNSNQNTFFRKAELQKNVLPKTNRQFELIIQKSAEILRSVYGYNLIVCDNLQNVGKAFIISNSLPYRNFSLVDELSDINKILLLLILSHIFMSGGSVSEVSLFSFLKELKIEMENRDPTFGKVREYISSQLVKQKFIIVEVDPVSKRVMYSWGPRAEKEINKLDILQFTCKVNGEGEPKMWTSQYEAAQGQGFDNNKQTADTDMETNND